MGILQIDEGRKRLRIAAAVVAAIVTYLYLLGSSYRVLVEDQILREKMFFEFPFIAAVVAGVTFLAVTGIYWVLEGFHPTKRIQQTNPTATRRPARPLPNVGSNVGHSDRPTRTKTPNVLFEVTVSAAKELQQVLVQKGTPMGPVNTGNMRLDGLFSDMYEYWQQGCLAYCYGLTCLFMLKEQPGFLKSDLADKFSASVLHRMVELAKKNNENFNIPNDNEERIIKNSSDDMKKVIVCVLDFAKQLNTKERDPLHLLNTYLANITGLKEKEHFDLMTRTSKELMRKIENKLAA